MGKPSVDFPRSVEKKEVWSPCSGSAPSCRWSAGSTGHREETRLNGPWWTRAAFDPSPHEETLDTSARDKSKRLFPLKRVSSGAGKSSFNWEDFVSARKVDRRIGLNGCQTKPKPADLTTEHERKSNGPQGEAGEMVELQIRRPAGVFCGLFWLVLLVLVSIYGLSLRADFSTA